MKKLFLLSSLFFLNAINAQEAQIANQTETAKTSYTKCECEADSSSQAVINWFINNSPYEVWLSSEACPTTTTGSCDGSKCSIKVSLADYENDIFIEIPVFTGKCVKKTYGQTSDKQDRKMIQGFATFSDLNSGNELNFYPNPANKTIIITNAAIFNSIEILSLDGKMVIQIQNQSKENQINIDTKDLNSGIYLIRSTSGDKTQYSKVIISEN